MNTLDVIVGAAIAWLSTWLSAWLSGRQATENRSLAFIQRQVEEFYSPMLGLRREIWAKGGVRVKVSEAAGSAWVEQLEGLTGERLQRVHESEWPKYEKITPYNNRQLTQELLPKYREMLSLFKEKTWLMEESTRDHYEVFVEFVEIWNRFEDGSLPGDVVAKLEHSEERLHPLYDDLERQLNRLRARLSAGKP